jgi:hypothetical protein
MNRFAKNICLCLLLASCFGEFTNVARMLTGALSSRETHAPPQQMVTAVLGRRGPKIKPHFPLS